MPKRTIKTAEMADLRLKMGFTNETIVVIIFMTEWRRNAYEE